MKPRINVVMSFLVGGAYVGLQRIAQKMPQFEWVFSEMPVLSDLLVYMNDHKHYVAAKKLGIKHIIQRKTGVRSLGVIEPDDLGAVICASQVSFNNSKHTRKVLIYNGVDLDHLRTIQPKSGVDLLIAESRIGVGQKVDRAIDYAKHHKRHLTILGSGEGLAENTYSILKKNNPQCKWVGRVDCDEALSYIKGSNGIIVSNPSHGIANQVIECVALGKPVISLANIEMPPKDQIDINTTTKKYDELIRSVLGES